MKKLSALLLPIMVVESVEEAISLSNDNIYGLGASVWTRDIENGVKVAKLINSGMTWINDINVVFPTMSMGRRETKWHW